MKLFIGIAVGAAVGILGTLLAIYVFLPTPPLPPAGLYGRFIGPVKPSWLDDGRKVQLNDDFVYIDPFNKAWVAPKGSVVDGASIPQGLWTIVGGPLEGKYRYASIVHDVACVEMKESSDDVHRMFYFACRCGGVDEARAKGLYFAVLKFGPQWNVPHAYAQYDEVPTETPRGINKRPPTEISKEDAGKILDYFQTNNPSLDKIPTLDVSDVRNASGPR
jgi:hypothetical protein